MRILYTEDNPTDADLTVRALERARPGWSIELVQTVEAAQARLLLTPAVDLLLADLRLPDGTGLELVSWIRAQGLPVAAVVVTGVGDEESAVAALKAGADDYLVKRAGYLGPLPALLEAAHGRERERMRRADRPVRILYAEHASDDVELTRRHLARHAPHLRIETVGSVPELMDRLPPACLAGDMRACPYDVLLMDYRLPGPSALDALKDLLHVRHLSIPILLVTGHGDEEVAVEALKLGAADYLVKRPGYLNRLPAAVENAFHRVELARGRAALQASEERYRTLFETSPLPSFAFERRSAAILAVNEAAIRHYGYGRDELATMTAYDLRPAEDVDSLQARLSSGDFSEPRTILTRHRKKDGSVFDAEVTVREAQVLGQAALLSVARDVTEQRALAEQLRQAQKMEAVGRLAGGVAHDFNNLLTVIMGACAEGLDEEGGAAREPLETILAAAQRAAGLTRQLLTFARRQVLQPRVLEPNLVVRDLVKMLPRLLGEDVRVETRLASGAGRVLADAGQLEQVILNLAVNARDAMPSGGTLTIETASVEIDEPYRERHPDARAGPHVMLAVSDTGIGLTPEVRRHLFEPFFTTKEPGTGTGLGLATVFGIVQQSGGFVHAYGEPGQGATFKVYLPRIDGEAEASPPGEAPPVRGGTETVLVAEDDRGVRSLVVSTLAAKGYAVIEAENGSEALAAAERHSGRIDLLVADVVMPAMGGRELADRLKARRRGIGVVYMSGYTDDAVHRRGAIEPGAAFLQKPFTPTALAAKVREVLDAKGRGGAGDGEGP